MSADIEKLAVFDARIVQPRPKYAVTKGALSLTNAPFQAIAQTASQHTYNIYVPSENVFVGRKIEWSSQVRFSVDVTITNNSGAALPQPAGIYTDAQPWNATPIVSLGRDAGLCAFPLNHLVSTLSATINDTTSVINSQDVMREI